MNKEHSAEIISIEGLEILAEPTERRIFQIGTLLKTIRVSNIFFIVLDDLYKNIIPGGNHEAFGISEEELPKLYPHVSDYLRYLIKIYPVAEYNNDKLLPVTKSPVMNALLYEVGLEEIKEVVENNLFIFELSRIDIKKFPKRNKAIITLFRNYLLNFEEEERNRVLRNLVVLLSTSFRNDYASLMEIVRGIK